MTLNTNNLSFLFLKLLRIDNYKFYNYSGIRTYYNVLFLGSDGLGLTSLRKVNEYRKKSGRISQLDLVTSNNSKNRTEIEKYAHSENIETLKWSHLDLHKGKYDIGLIVSFGHLIKQDALSKFPLGIVNVHPSLLPRWRGAAPIIYTLLHGDKTAGVSLMRIKPDSYDVGDIISQQKVDISKDIKLPELTEQLSDIGANMLVECLRTLPKSLENATPQANEGVTYAKKINKSISEVRWLEMTAEEVYNLYRAVYGLYSLTTNFRGRRMKLFNAFLLNTKEPECSGKEIGNLEYCKETDAIKILCKDRKYIYFKSLRVLGKREISASDFYNGYIKGYYGLAKRKYKVF